MKKKTIIILSSVVFTIILLIVLYRRGVLILADKSGFYSNQSRDAIGRIVTYLPEFSIVATLLAIYLKKSPGLVLTVISFVMALASLIGETYIYIIKSSDVVYKGIVPAGISPLLNIPVLIICVILFIIKFRIFSLPDKVKIKIK